MGFNLYNFLAVAGAVCAARECRWAYVVPAAADRAYACARGCYQRDVLAGREAISGSTLRGAKWRDRYYRSRCALLARLNAAGLIVGVLTAARGRRVLVVAGGAS